MIYVGIPIRTSTTFQALPGGQDIRNGVEGEGVIMREGFSDWGPVGDTGTRQYAMQ